MDSIKQELLKRNGQSDYKGIISEMEQRFMGVNLTKFLHSVVNYRKLGKLDKMRVENRIKKIRKILEKVYSVNRVGFWDKEFKYRTIEEIIYFVKVERDKTKREKHRHEVRELFVPNTEETNRYLIRYCETCFKVLEQVIPILD